MKKKIKDLTTKDVEIVCNNYQWCDLCPLYQTPKCNEYDEKEVKQKMEQEIEVEDETKNS